MYQSYEYYLTSGAELTIDSQAFSSTQIRGQTDANYVTIQNSGTIKIDQDVIDTDTTNPYTVSLTGATITIDSVSADTSASASSKQNETTTNQEDSTTAATDSTTPASDINNSDNNENVNATANTNSPPISNAGDDATVDEATK